LQEVYSIIPITVETNYVMDCEGTNQLAFRS